MGARAASTILWTEPQSSGPIPVPGIRVTGLVLPIPGRWAMGVLMLEFQQKLALGT